MLLRLSPPLIDLWAAVTMLEQEANGTSSHRIASHHIIEQCKEQLALDRWLTPKSLIHVRQNRSSDRPVSSTPPPSMRAWPTAPPMGF